jgi:serine/threonine protein kinase
VFGAFREWSPDVHAAMASALPQLQGLSAHLFQPPDAATQATLGIEGPLTHLGDGGFKSVYACTFNGTDAVVSASSRGLPGSLDLRAQAAEAAVQARLASQPPPHPHVNTALRGPVIVAGRSYTVLPRLQVTLFDEAIGDHPGTYPEATARTHFAQILSGLRHLHQLGVAHRDIKLENIMLTQGGEACLIDFDLSDVVPPGGSTLSTELKGTQSYAAPEVMAAGPGRPYDMYKADVWSLGVALFAMSTGFLLVETATPADNGFRVVQAAQQAKPNQCIVAALFNYYQATPLYQTDPQEFVRMAALTKNADLVDLLNRMLRIDPAKRMSLEEVSQSRWVAPGLQPAATSTVAGGGSSSSVDPDTLTAPSTLAVPPAPAFRSLGASSPAADSVPAPAYRGLAASSSVDVNFDDVLAAIPCVGPPPITRQKAHLGAA